MDSRNEKKIVWLTNYNYYRERQSNQENILNRKR
jgi:hypothetical protein